MKQYLNPQAIILAFDEDDVIRTSLELGAIGDVGMEADW